METTFKLSKGRTLKIVQDENTKSPRTWDNLAKFILVGKHKHLGDSHNVNHENYNSWDELNKAIAEDIEIAVVKPIYLYSHSGETISTRPFSCPWDSGQIGFAIVTKEAIRKEYSIKNVTEKYRKLAETVLDAEVETLDQYIQGEVYGFEVLDENNMIDDSCYGFYGSDIKTNGILDHITKDLREEVLKQIN